VAVCFGVEWFGFRLIRIALSLKMGRPMTTDEMYIDTMETVAESGAWMKLLERGLYARLTREFIRYFGHFRDYCYRGWAKQTMETHNKLICQFFNCMADRRYTIPHKLVEPLLMLNGVIGNAVDMSYLRTTDPVLAAIAGHDGNFWKMIVLLNCRCEARIPMKVLFDINIEAASLWYFTYFLGSGSYPGERVWKNMVRHVNEFDERLELPDQSALIAYFNSTYIDHEHYGKLKHHINKRIQEIASGIHIKNSSDGTIAVISSKWFKESSVFRCCSAGVDELRKRGHKLELVILGDNDRDMATEGFSAIKRVTSAGLSMDVSEIMDNKWSMAFYPDIGMSFESMYMSNLRLAPKQVMAYGHPSSTFGSLIDVFLGGADIEIVADAGRNYSEQLITLPGNGMTTNRAIHLNHESAMVRASVERKESRVVVNCPWSQDKITFPLIRALRSVKDAVELSGQKCVFRLFPNEALMRQNYFLPFVRQVEEVLGWESLEVHSLYGQDYLAKLAEGDCTFDSWPFGGYNTIIDSLSVGLPVLAMQGRQCFERIGAWLVAKVGLADLVATDLYTWQRLASRLICDSPWRSSLRDRLIDRSWEHLIYGDTNSIALADTIEGILHA
jgi:hypothetical protein